MELHVGVLADTKSQLAELQRLVTDAGHQVAVAFHIDAIGEGNLPPVNAWLVHLDLTNDALDTLLDKLDESDVPVIFDEREVVSTSLDPDETVADDDAFLQRVNRFKKKLDSLSIQSSAIVASAHQLRKPKHVWVLAASTGGPSAVATFLDGIPLDVSGVAFIYVQHIQESGMVSLKQVVEQHSDWKVIETDEPTVMQEKAIYLVSPANQVIIEEGGIIRPVEEPWVGDYNPSIDHVIAQVARFYGQNGGAMVFTGMGDDGAKSCVLLKHLRGQVWVQDTESCTIDSMPECVKDKTNVDVSADPEHLAQCFVQYQKTGKVGHGSVSFPG